MKRMDIIIGVLVSAGLHSGVLFGGELFEMAKKHTAAQAGEEETVTVSAIDFTPEPEEEKPPQEEQAEDTKEDNNSDSESDAGGDSSAAALPEPMNTVGVADITTVIKPTPPVAPKAESQNWNPPSKQTRQLDTNKFKDFVDLAKLDKRPQARAQTPPRYPFELKRQGISGECTVQFIVTSDGQVADAVVISSTHKEFEKPCLDAVMQWRFTPGMKDGRKVTTRMQQAFPFKLNN